MSRRLALLGLVTLVAAAGAVALPADDAEKLSARQAALVRAAERAYWGHKASYEAGRATAEDLYLWSRRWMEAAQSASDRREDKIAAAREHLARMTQMEAVIVTQSETGLASTAAESAAEFYRVEAELLLAAAGR